MLSYAKLYSLEEELAFAWCVHFTLKKKDQVVSSVKTMIKKTTRKYGILSPTTVEEAYKFDKQNSNAYLKDAIQKEIKNVIAVFRILSSFERTSVGYLQLKVHLVFDLKLDLTWKVNLVSDGHLTPDPVDSTYVGVV